MPWRRVAREAVVVPLRAYRVLISPALPRRCRFTPTCSAYAIDAVRMHGICWGGWLAARRLLRCHPACAGGDDPVPIPEKA